MQKIFIRFLLACFIVPCSLFAQNKTSSNKENYPGGFYPTWDSLTKKISWCSPARGNADAETFTPHSDVHNTSSLITASSSFRLVKDINAQSDGSPKNNRLQVYNQSYAVLNGVAYFAASDGAHGSELWRSDGTSAGTYMVKDIEPGINSSGISNIAAVNGMLYFDASLSENRNEPWISDGTEAGTHMLKDFSDFEDRGAAMFTGANGKVFFANGYYQLCVTDGTEAGTRVLPVAGSNIDQLVSTGNILYFTAESYPGGKQLWRSDGTDTGTYMLKPAGGYTYEDPQQLTGFNNKVYFSAMQDDSYRKLWVSDGTNAGTYRVKDNNVQLKGVEEMDYFKQDAPMTIYNNELYFVGFSDATFYELYKYNFNDGEGIVLVKDITPNSSSTNISFNEIKAYGNGVAFKVINPDGTASLWTTKGKASNTKLVKTFPTYNNTNFANLYNASGSLIFEAYLPASGYELWKSNGTTAGTTLIKDIFTGTNSSYPYYVTALGGNILFSANNGASGYELWKSNATAGGTTLLKDINQYSNSSMTSWPLIANTPGGVIFSATNGISGVEPYTSDGKAANTSIVADIAPGETSSTPWAYKTVNNNTYFLAHDENKLSTLFKLNNITKQVEKLYSAPQDRFIMSQYAVTDNGLVFFAITDPYLEEIQIWRTDGTTAGSFMLKSTNIYINEFEEIVAVNNTAFFPFYDPVHGQELFKSDGTISGTGIVSEIKAGSSGSNPYDLILYNSALFFAATFSDGTFFCKVNASGTAVEKLAQLTPSEWYYYAADDRSTYCISNNLLYINAHNNTSGQTLWVTNGTAGGTKKAANATLYDINNLTDVNGKVYFSASTTANGNELWKSNGSTTGTTIVKDLTAGSGSSNISNFCSVSNQLFFVKDGSLWSSTGTATTTLPVSDTTLNTILSIDKLIGSGNKLFLIGFANRYGRELYVATISAQGLVAQNKNNSTVKNITSNPDVTISPNPVHDIATVNLPGIKKADVMLMDNNGRIIWQQKNINQSHLHIPMNHYAPGIYYVKIMYDQKYSVLKLMKN